MNKEFFSRFFFGIFLIALAFFAAGQKSPVMGLFGFLAFFVAGMTVIVESFRKMKKR